MAKPKQIDPVEILNDDDRIFKSWGTVEVRDKEGDLIPINEFKNFILTGGMYNVQFFYKIFNARSCLN